MERLTRRRDWNDLETWLLDKQIETGNAVYQDAATLLYQQRKALTTAHARIAALEEALDQATKGQWTAVELDAIQWRAQEMAKRLGVSTALAASPDSK